jgi:hypothetical protein
MDPGAEEGGAKRRAAKGQVDQRLRLHIVAFASGLLFAIGLGLAGMTNPHKVLNFLDVLGDWDPSLALVMLGAILVYAPVYRHLQSRPTGPKLCAPTKKDIDLPLVVGSILFGIGWGITGFCPGPAVVAVVTGQLPVLVFFAAMVAGMLARGFVGRRAQDES